MTTATTTPQTTYRVTADRGRGTSQTTLDVLAPTVREAFDQVAALGFRPYAPARIVRPAQ